MVVSFWFTDHKEFNLFCQLMSLKKNEIINVSHERGKVFAVIDRNVSVSGEWEDKKTEFLKQIKG